MISIDTIKNSGFSDVEQLQENIFYIKSFMSKEDMALANNIIANLSEQDWSILDKEHAEDWEGKLCDHNNGLLNESLRSKVSKLANVFSNYAIVGYNRILRQSPGKSMEAHVDPRNDINNGSTREYAAVIYLNDNYSGGEINYVNLGIKIKPEAGSLVIFKTGPKYSHEVLEVSGSMPRYCFPGFIFSSWPNQE